MSRTIKHVPTYEENDDSKNAWPSSTKNGAKARKWAKREATRKTRREWLDDKQRNNIREVGLQNMARGY